MSENMELTKFQSIIYKGLLRAEDPNDFTNLFEILDEVHDELSEAFWIMDYSDPGFKSIESIILYTKKVRE